ncbi:hypothetical protein K439DRAFT_1402474 [Ramaria rubella]|nr:hypothetical protein K439DRAFT_1402474 [Ramaria rubella]
MTTIPTLLDVPPYRLQHLFSNVKELLGGTPDRPSSRTGRATVEVRCAQALGTEIYVGCSDGALLRYAFVDSLDSEAESYQLLTHQALSSGHPIEQIVLAPSIEKVLVLCNHLIHFFTLPNLEPVEDIKPIRNVVTFALDDAQQRKSSERRSHQPESVNVCVIKRSSISVYNLGIRLGFRKEIPLPNGATLARLSNKHLCVADEENYNVIDLDTANMIPLLPLSQAADSLVVKPSITVISEDEFLLLSWTGTTTLGVFIMGTGDPVRGTLEWGMHPVALCCEYPYVTSMLPNGTIEVHSLESQSICQIILSSGSFSPIALVKSSQGYVIPSGDQKHKLDVVDFSPFEPDAPNTSAIEESAIRDAPPNRQTSLPRRHDSLRSSSTKDNRTRQPKAVILAVGTDAVYALATLTLTQQADALLEAHKLKEATNLAKEHQKKIEQMKRLSQSSGENQWEAQNQEIYYIYQRVGYKCLSETIFEDAGNNLFRGNVDPRLLVRLFPALRGTLLSSSSVSLPVFAGLEPQMRSLGSVDTIIVTNLVKNYSPHLQPNTRSAPPTSELRKLLMVSARDMLREYLRKWKNKVLYSGESPVKEISQVRLYEVIDTVLVKLLAESEDTQELYALLESSEDIIIEEVEETLIRTGQYNALFNLHQKANNKDKLLEILSRLVEGVWTDEDIQDPLGKMTALLDESRDRTLVQRWGLWLVKQDTATGLKFLMTDSKRSTKADDSMLLTQIEAVNADAGRQFLEYIVLQKHSKDSDLHTRLALMCLNRFMSALQSGEVLEFFKDAAFEYSIQNTSIPFLTHLVTNIEASSPMYEFVRTRCCLALFLQGSTLYDVHTVRDRLSPWEEVLGFEIAITDGKLGKHVEALKALVHTLRDTASADAYCGLGGCAISPKVAQFLGERLDLRTWAALVVDRSNRRGGKKVTITSSDDLEETRSRLLKVLLEVYMSGGETTEGHTARLLNSQGGNLDVLDVLSLVPPAWPLNVVSSFLRRSLRQSVHERCEGEIVKAVCLGQNLEVQDNVYARLREQGAFVQESALATQPQPPQTEQKETMILQEEKFMVETEKRERVDEITLQDVKNQMQLEEVANGEIT